LDYRIHPVDISAGDQFKPDFLAFSPDNRMPAIIDNHPADGEEGNKILFDQTAINLRGAEPSDATKPDVLPNAQKEPT
jgi:GST-like protein